jgi:hypothetical protein
MLIFFILTVLWWYLDRSLSFTCFLILSLQFSDIYAIVYNLDYFYFDYYTTLVIGVSLFIYKIINLIDLNNLKKSFENARDI